MIRHKNHCSEYLDQVGRELNEVTMVYCLEELSDAEKMELIELVAGLHVYQLEKMPPMAEVMEWDEQAIRSFIDQYLGLQVSETHKDGTRDFSKGHFKSSGMRMAPKDVLKLLYRDGEAPPYRATAIREGVDIIYSSVPYRTLNALLYHLEPIWIREGVRFYNQGKEMICRGISQSCPVVYPRISCNPFPWDACI